MVIVADLVSLILSLLGDFQRANKDDLRLPMNSSVCSLNMSPVESSMINGSLKEIVFWYVFPPWVKL